MFTRSRNKHLATTAKSTKVTRSETSHTEPIADGLGRSKSMDLKAAEATETSAVHDATRACPVSTTADGCSAPGAEPFDVSASYRSQAGSSWSSATIRARRLSAKAELARRSMEREQELMAQENARQRELLEQVKLVEQLEMEAALAAQEAEERSARSVSSVHSRTASWVRDVNQASSHHHTHTTYSPPVVSQSKTNKDDIILKAIADTAAAAKALASGSKAKIELPAYFGNASQWLQFKRIFTSTESHYSPAENVARLENALRGPARQAVASLLHAAAGPEEIMHALERTFACPEMIVFGEVQILKTLPRLGADLKEIGIFANKVRNSLSTMKLLGLPEYLHSPELFHSILGKLNPLMKMRWSDYASEMSNHLMSKLELLSDFMTREHERYIKFALSPEIGLVATQQYGNLPVNRQFIRRENFHALSQVKHKINDNTEYISGCVYCNKSHDIKNCSEFSAMSVENRWCWLRDHKICYKCLKRKSHQWRLCKVNPCGVDGCKFRHHPLLHGRQDTSALLQMPKTQAIHNTVCSGENNNTGLCHFHVSGKNTGLCINAVNNDDYCNDMESLTNIGQCKKNDDCTTPQLSKESVMVSNTGILRDEIVTPTETNNTLLKVVPVIVSGPGGSYETFALLDDGSTASLIDSNVAARIGVSGPEELITVNAVGGLRKTTKISYVDFYIQGRHENERFLVKRARAMPSLNLNTQTLSKRTVQSYDHLNDLTDCLTYTNATPTVLIGAEHWHLSISRAVRAGSRNQPVACHTWLGWTLYGVASSKTKPVEFINHSHFEHAELTEHERLELLIKEQYKLDSLGISKHENLHCKLDARAIEILDNTTTRLPSGRYEVGLPWRDNIQCVPDSYPQALSRFLSLERRMLREPDFAEAYTKFIDNMITKCYAEECDPATYYGHSVSARNELMSGDGPVQKHTLLDSVQHGTVAPNKVCLNFNQVTSTSSTDKKKVPRVSHDANQSDTNATIRWYLPHFGVYHPQKRKLRVVHDAAAMNQGVSLNSMLLQGPDLLENLLGIFWRFREGAVALTADIKEMFPQIRIREQDRDALRFLWRDVRSRNTTPIKEYRMTAVIFGASSSPFTALYIKNKNAMSHQDLYPKAANASIHSSYMDDFLDSLDDVTEAAQLASDVVTIHRNACFEMCGWISNNEEALRLVPTELRAAQRTEVSLGSESSKIRVLGVSWDPISDSIGFRTGLEELKMQGVFTKRKALSHLMKVYDPLGLLGPLLVKGRILLQDAWRSSSDWDTAFPPAQVLRWNEWFKELSDVSVIRIPRWYAKVNGEPLNRELHVFSDASELAYACVAYWRFLYADGKVELALIGSKARVSPLKPTSIPRLELQGALIASRLAATIKEFHTKKPIRTFFWTDSRTVLSWLKSDARTFKPFVAHRVGEITETSRVLDWRWVPTELNVADDATRIKSLQLNPNHRWFTGPSFLLASPEDWPVEPAGQPPVHEELKLASGLVVGHLVITADFNRFSDWLRLLRATARVLQAASKFRSVLDRVRHLAPNTNFRIRQRTNTPTSTSLLPLSAELMEAAERHVLQKIQSETFTEEIQRIERGKLLPKNSRLAKLSPKMGTDNLLHLVGRIEAVEDVGTEVKSPILLDGRHPVVRLLVLFYHRKAGHANNEMVVNELRQKYWLLSLRNTVRNVASKCLFCRIRKSKPMNPMTGNLPPQRLAHHRRPFTFTGLDYFGPINTTIGRKKEKRYVALFTCLTSRAVHLELVHSLSSDSAIMSLRRFIARRGAPDTIFSDNGTCFVGANRVLREFYHTVVSDYSASNGIKWSFIPPAAPFFGGCWERLVRSVKVALNATLRERAPNPEVLETLLLEAEAIVNSRPLSHVSVRHDDQETLTPYHFLLGTSSNQVLPATLDDRDLLRRADWRKALRLADHFWNRWVKEVLPTMQPRHTGENRERSLNTGDLVLVVDENLPRGMWPRGRITATFPGRDGVVRVVDVATQGGLLRRPAKKIVWLDF